MTQTAPEGRTRRSPSEETSGEMKAPRTGCCRTMTANDTTPCGGESADGEQSVEQRVARSVVLGHLDSVADRLIQTSRARGMTDEEIVENIEAAQAELNAVAGILDEECQKEETVRDNSESQDGEGRRR